MMVGRSDVLEPMRHKTGGERKSPEDYRRLAEKSPRNRTRGLNGNRAGRAAVQGENLGLPSRPIVADHPALNE
jgi:hypothetical protein